MVDLIQTQASEDWRGGGGIGYYAGGDRAAERE